MPQLKIFFFTALMTISAAQVMIINDANKLEIRENNTVVRTQFIPVKKVETDAGRRIDEFRCGLPGKDNVHIRNSTYGIRNGTLYKITRVKKRIRKIPCDTIKENNVAQRRNSRWDDRAPWWNQNVTNPEIGIKTNKPRQSNAQLLTRKIGNALYSIIPKLSSGHWQIQKPAMDRLQARNDTAERIWKFWTNSNPVATKTIAKKKEKIKKLLNLFTIVQFDNEGCYVDGLKGTCYHGSECAERGGQPMGPCARGFGVCCYIERTCGQATNENCTYFVNEGFPQPSSASPSICALSVQKAHHDVRQLRLEFETFELRGPVNGSCLMDRFLVTGQNRNSIVPDMCGVNTGQHMYVDVDAVSGPFTLNMVTMGQDPGRKWRVKVTQLRPGNELLAPQNCLQYYTELSGVIESFNYQHFTRGNVGEAAPGYFNNLNYDVCIKKGDVFCTVTYSNQPENEQEMPFELINMDANGEPLIPRGQAGAELFNCPDDYIVVNGVRLCGDRLNDATTELDYTKNAPVTDVGGGPVQLTVKTNQDSVSRGFRLMYKQNPCLE